MTDLRHRGRAVPPGSQGRSAGTGAALALVLPLVVVAASVGGACGWLLLRGRLGSSALAARVTDPLRAALIGAGAGPTGAPGSATAGTSAGPTTGTSPTSPTGGPGADQAGLTAADRAAGLRSTRIPARGTGKLLVVPGSRPAPGSGPVQRVRVEIEGGLDVDPQAFAGFVLNTLNDPRSWGHGGRMTFARTDGPADIRVVLASPDTSARLCAPMETKGTLSCGQGNMAVLTLYRWVLATPDYGPDRTGYRHYLVNHEVGHTLGHGHQPCPGPGKPAPVMMQQTKGLLGCLPNPWPYP